MNYFKMQRGAKSIVMAHISSVYVDQCAVDIVKVYYFVTLCLLFFSEPRRHGDNDGAPCHGARS